MTLNPAQVPEVIRQSERKTTKKGRAERWEKSGSLAIKSTKLPDPGALPNVIIEASLYLLAENIDNMPSRQDSAVLPNCQ